MTPVEREGSQDWDRLIQTVAGARDSEAFGRLFDHFAGRIKTYMLRSGSSESAADDLAQEAMLTVWRKAALFDPSRAGAAAWIFTIARNLRIDAARRDRRGGIRNLAEVDSEFDVDSTPLPDDRLVAAESVQLLRSALTQLSLAEIRVIELSFFQDKAHAEIAAGALDLGAHVAIATHLASCPRCRGHVVSLENRCGDLLEALPPSEISKQSLSLIGTRLDESVSGARPDFQTKSEVAISRLPRFVRRYHFGHWQWIAPKVGLRTISLPEPSETRVFLLRSGRGTKMIQHSHDGVEMSCVLAGAFTHEGGRFEPGDFDFGDQTIDHRPIVDAHADCICLVAMRGKLRLHGLLGRLVQPFLGM